MTGGASFIGSHLVDKLVERKNKVRIVDDLSTGKLENIRAHIDSKRIEFVEADLREPGITRKAMEGIQVVFHLAADHGGRGYIDLHQAGPASNLYLDGLVFFEAEKGDVEKVVYASSGCVYPNSLQKNPEEEIYLEENIVGPPYDADNIYGWAKLMAELTLKAYCSEKRMKAVSCRYFTAYGPRCLESHAVTAMIGRAFIEQDPYEVWGDGTQVRNWTYIDDIVEGTIRAAEMIDDGTAVNIGTTDRIRVIDAARMVQDYTGHNVDIRFLSDMPTGPLNRVADNSLALKLLNWEPRVSFKDGLARTIDWYFSTKNKEQVETSIEKTLTER